ncbi:hypothetical protein [Cohnella sp. GCM10027633]|uniref:hypothetical protein n=1 Tax=unclassified Cohnella TaxID=2636738 RepID=UPI003626A133
MNNFMRKWERTRAKGRGAFVLRYGVLYIGMITTLIFSIAEIVNFGKISVAYLVARMIIFPTIGAMIAGQLWESREKKYVRLNAPKL